MQPPCGACAGGLDRPPPCAAFQGLERGIAAPGRNHRRKYIREAIYGLKEPPQEETVEIIRMSEVDTQTVEWLWEPYIPFGKVTIVQGNPGEGKTTFALRLAAACTTRGTLPGMKPLPPFQVIYQTAEDGLGDTVKPRLMEAEADLDRVLVIDEAKRELTLSDERIEKQSRRTGRG